MIFFEASYVRFHGNTELSLDKVVDVIRYFSLSINVINLYKVKLMKLMWSADALAYKRRGVAITGLVYRALPMGAVPVGHNSIIDLKNVPCEEIDMQAYVETAPRDIIIRVYNDEICETIDNYNASAYYEPSYVIARAYNEGGF